MPARRFIGKVALVTGAARGQGRAVALRLAEEGADVVVIDACRDFASIAYPGATPEDLADTAATIEKHGRRVVSVQADVRDLEAMGAAVAKGLAQLGRLDVVVANAGICSAGMSWELSLEQWRETIDVNLTGAFVTAKVTVPELIKQGSGGSIVFTSSVAGLRGLPFLAHYAASKHGVVGLCRSMANELGQFNIRVNSIHPHGVNTGMQVSDLAPYFEQYATTLAPLFMQTLPDPMSEPDDIAAAVAWLASDEARHVTGIQLPIDLGVLTR
jgi:SDR family mycofactocin-dependent oxidoreductase